MIRDFPCQIVQKITQDGQAINMDSLERAVRNTRSAGAVSTLVARLLADRNGITPAHPAEILMWRIFEFGEAEGGGLADFRLL